MSDLIHRLRCKYPVGPIGADGEPEFGWRDFSGPAPAGMMLPAPINLEAADEIERLQKEVEDMRAIVKRYKDDLEEVKIRCLSY